LLTAAWLSSCEGSAVTSEVGRPPQAQAGLVGASEQGTVYAINEYTGEISPLMELWYEQAGVSIPLSKVEAMAFDEATGTLFAASGNLFQGTRSILKVDLSTGRVTAEKDITDLVGSGIYDMAIRPSDGALIVAGDNLVKYSPESGVAQNMGALTALPTGRGIAFCTDDDGVETLYMVGVTDIYTVNHQDSPGTATLLGNMPFTDGTQADPFFSAVAPLEIQSIVRMPDGRIMGAMNLASDPLGYLVEVQPHAPGGPDAHVLPPMKTNLDGLVNLPVFLDVVTPGPIAALTIGSGLNSVVLKWGENPTAENYNVFWSTSTMGGDTGHAQGSFTVDRPVLIHSGVTPATKYYYLVQAVNAAGTGPVSQEVSLTAAPTNSPPVNIRIEARGEGVGVNWYPVQGAESYNIYWATASMAGLVDNAEGIINTSDLDVFLSQGAGAYYVMISALNGFIETPPSAEVTATAVAPQYVFDFDNGTFQGWQATGLWHVGNEGALSGGHMARFAHPVSGFLALVTASVGELVSPEISLSSPAPAMTFFYRQQGEYADGTVPFSYDKMTVQVSVDNGATWVILAPTPERHRSYAGFRVDLGSYAGMNVKLKFHYTSKDNKSNDFFGVYLDDISIY